MFVLRSKFQSIVKEEITELSAVRSAELLKARMIFGTESLLKFFGRQFFPIQNYNLKDCLDLKIISEPKSLLEMISKMPSAELNLMFSSFSGMHQHVF